MSAANAVKAVVTLAVFNTETAKLNNAQRKEISATILHEVATTSWSDETIKAACNALRQELKKADYKRIDATVSDFKVLATYAKEVDTDSGSWSREAQRIRELHMSNEDKRIKIANKINELRLKIVEINDEIETLDEQYDLLSGNVVDYMAELESLDFTEDAEVRKVA